MQQRCFRFRNSILVSFWSLKIHTRLTQRVTQFTAEWKICLEFFHLDCNVIFIIEESWNLTFIATTPFFSLEIQQWSLFRNWKFIKANAKCNSTDGRMEDLPWTRPSKQWKSLIYILSFALLCWFEENISLRRKWRTV